jgi:predicted deacylase
MNKKSDKAFITLGNQTIGFDENRTINLPIAQLYTDTPVNLPVRVITGAKQGPVIFISGAVHGDEIIGVEVIRRLLHHPAVKKLELGGIIAVPILNLFGFLLNSRYLPDRRDLNRSFPGSSGGSLASRIAHLFMTDVVENCTHGIDIHAGSFYRENLPQIRANISDPETAEMAKAFAAPVVIGSNLRDGSLRQAATEKNIKMLVYEAGEALRFDEEAAKVGVNGILGVLSHLGIIQRPADLPEREPRMITKHTTWVRAPRGGILWNRLPLGMEVKKDYILAMVSDPFGNEVTPIKSPENGLIIGRANLPTTNEGDGLFHLATLGKTKSEAEPPVDPAQTMVQPD